MRCRGITQGSAAISSRELESEAIKRSSEVDVYYLEGCQWWSDAVRDGVAYRNDLGVCQLGVLSEKGIEVRTP